MKDRTAGAAMTASSSRKAVLTGDVVASSAARDTNTISRLALARSCFSRVSELAVWTDISTFEDYRRVKSTTSGL